MVAGHRPLRVVPDAATNLGTLTMSRQWNAWLTASRWSAARSTTCVSMVARTNLDGGVTSPGMPNSPDPLPVGVTGIPMRLIGWASTLVSPT